MLCNRHQRQRLLPSCRLCETHFWQGYRSLCLDHGLDSEDATYMVTLAAVR